MVTQTCQHDGCERSIKDHRWGKTKADGWFQQRDGILWCPEHVPEWVAGWRKRRDEKDDGDDQGT